MRLLPTCMPGLHGRWHGKLTRAFARGAPVSSHSEPGRIDHDALDVRLHCGYSIGMKTTTVTLSEKATSLLRAARVYGPEVILEKELVLDLRAALSCPIEGWALAVGLARCLRRETMVRLGWEMWGA